MPIKSSIGILEVEDAKLRASYLLANTAIGIGTATVVPSGTSLYINDDNPMIRLNEGTATSSARILTKSGTLRLESGIDYDQPGVSGDIAFSNIQGGTTHMIIKGSGHVGIGTDSPASAFHINSTDSIVLPSGTTAERNQTPTIGMLRYNSETGYLEAYTAGGWGSIATPPTITSFSPIGPITPAASNGTDLTINGGFFDENTTVQLRAQNGTLYSTTNLVFTNSGLITVTLGSLAADSYTLVVTNGAGLSVDSTSTLVVNNPPVWSSPAAGATLEFFTDISSTTTLSATDPDGGTGTITYSLVSGTLPSGLTLSGSTISGTSGASAGTQTPITIRAGDGLAFADRSFTIETIAPLYSFSSHTFTNAGQTGRTGPTLTQCRNAYNVTWDEDTSLFNVTGGIQYWTVPTTATYQIAAYGAQGGNGQDGTLGGNGARMRGDFNLTKGEVIRILVGQLGGNGGYSAGGGGGSFVVRTPYTTTQSILAIAGGGGGGGDRTTYTGPNPDGIDRTGVPGTTATSGTTGRDGILAGGSNGSGGTGTTSPWGGAGGGGFSTNGGTAKVNGVSVAGSGGVAFTASGTGGVDGSGNYTGPGGFGGGGGSSWGAAGGGGYSGGAGDDTPGFDDKHGGGGGGSYNSGLNQSNASGARSGHGQVIITKL